MSSTGQPFFIFGAWRRGSASALGAESRWFKSSRPDHFGVVTVCRDSFFICRQTRWRRVESCGRGASVALFCAFWSERAYGSHESGSRGSVLPEARGQAAALSRMQAWEMFDNRRLSPVFTGNFLLRAENGRSDLSKNPSLTCDGRPEISKYCCGVLRRRG